jgi:flagellar FliJ protein
MKFKFSLQKVLDHRKTLQNLAQRDFEEAQAEQHRQQEILMDMITGQHEARQEAGRVQEFAMDAAPERLKQIHQFTVLQDVRIERQKAKVVEASNLVEAKREILRLKAIDSKIMERLREKKREEFLLEQKQLEQKEVDEINVLRYDAKDGE